MTPRGTYLRVGSSVQQMTPAMINEQYTERTHNTLGLMVSPVQELTFAQLKIYYEERGHSVNDAFLRNLGLINRNGDYNYAAYLLSDVNGISLKVARYAGTDKIDLIENEEMGYCSLVKATLQILDKLEVINVTRTKITGKRRMEKRLVDSRALREAVINAIVHNDYSRGIAPAVEIFSDRIMITSAGGLPQNLTEEEFFDGISAPRNQELMRIFRDLELVEQLGSGMRRILENYDKSIFTFSPNYLRVTFRYSEPLPEQVQDTIPDTINGTINGTINDSLSPTQKCVIAAVLEHPGGTYQELATRTGLSRRTIARVLTDLQAKKIIIRIGARKSGYWQIQQE